MLDFKTLQEGRLNKYTKLSLRLKGSTMLICFSGPLQIGMFHFHFLNRGNARHFAFGCLPTGTLEFKILQEGDLYKYTKLPLRLPNLMSFIFSIYKNLTVCLLVCGFVSGKSAHSVAALWVAIEVL